MKILIVEDEPAIQDLIQVNLEMGGYRVLTHDNAEAALKGIQTEIAMRVLVAHGSCRPNSSKIFLNFGMIEIMMKVTMAVGPLLSSPSFAAAANS